MLLENLTPYTEPLDDHPDEEWKWCYVKNENLKKDPKFRHMYLLDEQNRTAILNAAGFEFNLFSPVPRLENGKNPYGLNGCMGAIIDYFYQLNFLKRNIPWSKSSKHTCSIPVILSGS